MIKSKAPGQTASVPELDVTVKRFVVLAAVAGLSTWAVDMAATQVGLPSMQSSPGVSVTASQRLFNISLMLLACLVSDCAPPVVRLK